MRRSYTIGDTLFGVNNGGKHSIDATHLRQAEATGRVTVATQHEVTSIARGRDGKWIVNVSRTDKFGRVVGRKVYTTRALILAAGSLNTQQAAGQGKADRSHPTCPTASATAGAPTATALSRGRASPLIWASRRVGPSSTARRTGPIRVPPTPSCRPQHHSSWVSTAAARCCSDAGASGTRGSIGVDPLTGNPTIAWPFGGDAGSPDRLNNAAHRIGGIDPVADLNLVTPFTWHPLGGANMGVVCDLEGRARPEGPVRARWFAAARHRCRVQPSMTIAAVAERAMDRIVARDVGSVI